MRIMFERYYSFFHYCVLSCRFVMFQKCILCKPKWGGHSPPGSPVAMALGVVTPKLFQNICLLHIYKYKKKTGTHSIKPFKKLIFVGHFGGLAPPNYSMSKY